MNKREFIKKAGALSASTLILPSIGFSKTSSNMKPVLALNNELNAPMNLVIGSDHMGYPLKLPLIELLKSWNHNVKDVGSFTPEPVDFPDIALLLADEIKSGRAKLGIMVCGTGIGAGIAANKIQGIRAATVHDTYSAHQCVEHDNANVICFGAQIIGRSIAEEILYNFLNAEFSTSEEFRRRVQKLNDFDLVPPEK
jgi:ribose 5-phosphate isomerase B